MAQTATERGHAYATELEPFTDFARIVREQGATAHVRELLSAVDLHIARAIDPGEMLQRAGIGTTLLGPELRAIGDAIATAAAAYNKVTQRPADPIEQIVAAYKPLREVQKAIAEALDEQGIVLDRASPALHRIRRNLRDAHAHARDRATALLRSSKLSHAIQDAVVTIRNGRFVVPIKAEFAGEVPGIVHDTSSSGQTLFVEPLSTLEDNNRVRRLQIDEEHEVARILGELSQLIGKNASQIEANAEMLAQIDVLVAKARVGERMDAHKPEIVARSELVIERGRHPLLAQRAVPQSLALDATTRFLVISGPNMGGKTVTLKMAGLFVLMCYAGLQIPAQTGSRIGHFTQLFADIGDEQSIALNASTFSAHLARLRTIVEKADAHTLVLVDEIGAGTEPASGAALAIALLERLLKVQASGIVTTHSTELKLFAHETDGVQNASVRFDPQSFAPTYHLDVGTPGQSLAFPLARSLGVPNQLLERAEALLSTQDREYERALTELGDATARLQNDRESVERERRHLETLESNARARADALERERRSFAENAEAKLRQTLLDFAARLDASQGLARSRTPKRGQAEQLQRTLEELHRDLGLTADAEAPGSEERRSQELATGDAIRIISLAQDATVITDSGDNVLAAIGPMKMLVSKKDVRKIVSAPRRASAGASEAILAAGSQTMPELDVRGKRFAEAEPLVDRWIDEALLTGNSPLRLIHGKGTGMLGRGLQEFLRAHPQVSNVRYGTEEEGGGGVTIFELR